MTTIAETRNGNRKRSEEWPLNVTEDVEQDSNNKGAARTTPLGLPYPDTYQLLSLKVQKAFHRLRGKGYECYADSLCCHTCALASITGDKYVFWHEQDADFARKNNSLSLAWDGEPNVIIEGLRSAWLDVEWDGDHRHRIVVRLREEVAK